MLSRLKFDIKPLVNEMLDRAPADVWTRTNTTFLDPAAGGGQFLVEICNRLLKAGHSWDNIESRVFGLADSPLSLNFAKNKYKIRGQFAVGSIETLEQWVTISKKFDVVVGNPPYNKTESEPLYYEFTRLLAKIITTDGHGSFIIPAGWLVGKKATEFRSKVFSTLNVSEIVYNDSSAFGGQVSQPTVVLHVTPGVTTTYTFTRKFNNQSWSANINTADFDVATGYPLVIGEMGLSICKLADNWSYKFDMRREANTHCVYVSDANNTASIETTDRTFTSYLDRIQTPFRVADKTVEKNRNHHICKSHAEALNVQRWLESKLAKLIFLQWTTTHRNVGSNLGRMPVVIVNGTYSDEAAYKKLGLTQDQIDWVNAL